MTKIIIVAGGLATRMKPITESIPKCLIDINSKPLIEHQLELFKSKGFKDIIFCVAHLADKVKSHLGDGKKFGVNIQYVQETKELMGTAGSVKLAENMIDDDFVVYYGDNLTNMDFDALLKFHKTKKALATVVVRPAPQGYKGSSLITLDTGRKITKFLEKPSEEDLAKHGKEPRYINNGIYVLSEKVFDIIPAGVKHDFAKEVFPKMITDKLGIYGYVTEEFFREIGRVEKYDKFLEEVKCKKNIFEKTPAAFIDRDGVINENVKNMTKPEQVKLVDGAAEGIKTLNDAGYRVIVVTNQPIIAKGFCTFEDMDAINDKIKELLQEKGAKMDAIYMCPHHPEKGFDGEVPELKIDCDCRKPKPGLILKAALENNIDLARSWMIGDSPSDILAGKNARVKTILVTAGGGSGAEHEKGIDAVPDAVKKDMREAAGHVLRNQIQR